MFLPTTANKTESPTFSWPNPALTAGVLLKTDFHTCNFQILLIVYWILEKTLTTELQFTTNYFQLLATKCVLHVLRFPQLWRGDDFSSCSDFEGHKKTTVMILHGMHLISITAWLFSPSHPHGSAIIFSTWCTFSVALRISLILHHHMGIYLRFHWYRDIKNGFKTANTPFLSLRPIPLQ